MPELALHILDLVENSISAGAKHVTVSVRFDDENGRLFITIEDDGRGMDEELLSSVRSPFVTTRTTRKVGLGLPLFDELAGLCNGSLTVWSRPGEGTRLAAEFDMHCVDLPPMGDLKGTFLSLVAAQAEKTDFRLEVSGRGQAFVLDTEPVRKRLMGVPLNAPDVLDWFANVLEEGFGEVQIVS